jgi:hypothetical protein
MRLRVRQIRLQLGLAFATVLLGMLSSAAPGGDAMNSGIGPPAPEFVFARLAYDDGALGFRGGFGGGAWTTDTPGAEQHLLQGIRRLTRLNTIGPTEGPVMPVRFNDELFNYPFLYAVEVGRWYLNDAQAAQLRDYLLRGGFLVVDDFHGTVQWEAFMESMRRVFPDREVVEIPEDHEVFHLLFDLDRKVQIPGTAALMSGRTYEQDGVEPHWRGIFDDKGRLMVVINFNMDMGDAWENADLPEYPHHYTALAYRFAINYAIYAMSH